MWLENYENYAQRVDNDPGAGTRCMVRGGSWNYNSNDVRAAFRGRGSSLGENVGLRVAWSPDF